MTHINEPVRSVYAPCRRQGATSTSLHASNGDVRRHAIQDNLFPDAQCSYARDVNRKSIAPRYNERVQIQSRRWIDVDHEIILLRAHKAALR